MHSEPLFFAPTETNLLMNWRWRQAVNHIGNLNPIVWDSNPLFFRIIASGRSSSSIMKFLNNSLSSPSSPCNGPSFSSCFPAVVSVPDSACVWTLVQENTKNEYILIQYIYIVLIQIYLFCQSHSQQWTQEGTSYGVLQEDDVSLALDDEFWRFVEPNPNGCWWEPWEPSGRTCDSAPLLGLKSSQSNQT